MKSVFITRKLAKDSIFKNRLESVGFQVCGESLILFSAVQFNEIPKTDWIFFYSKNGVKYFFQGMKNAGLQIPENVKWAAVGPQTAKMIAAEYKEPDFIGSGNPKQTAFDFLKIAKGQKVLFPQAEFSAQSIQQLIENKAVTKKITVYKNTPKEKINIPFCKFLAFTSPLNASIYFEKKPVASNQKIFAIGQTTANRLKKLGITDFRIAESPSEEGLVKIILKSLKSST